MPTAIHTTIIGLAVLGMSSLCADLRAEDGVLTLPTRASAIAAGPGEETATRPSAFNAKPVNAAVLGLGRGGSQVLNDMKLNGVVADNQASQLTTGANFISEGAFNGSSGLLAVIQNSGSNVLIQNATIVNVQIKP
jgi:hypothetical protein